MIHTPFRVATFFILLALGLSCNSGSTTKRAASSTTLGKTTSPTLGTPTLHPGERLISHLDVATVDPVSFAITRTLDMWAYVARRNEGST